MSHQNNGTKNSQKEQFEMTNIWVAENDTAVGTALSKMGLVSAAIDGMLAMQKARVEHPDPISRTKWTPEVSSLVGLWHMKRTTERP